MAFFILFFLFPFMGISGFLFFLIAVNDFVFAIGALLILFSAFIVLLPLINLWLLETLWNKSLYSIVVNQSEIFNLLAEKISDKKLKKFEVCIIPNKKVTAFYFCKSWFGRGLIICNELTQVKDCPLENKLINSLKNFYLLTSNLVYKVMVKKKTKQGIFSDLKFLFLNLCLHFIKPPRTLFEATQ